MVTNLLSKEDVDKDFEELILEKAEGVPFFITPSLSLAGQ